MGFSKWIGGALGWSFGGPIGAILGVALGSVVDAMSDSDKTVYQRTYGRGQTQSGDFEVSLLILASVVIKADGKQDQRELDFVRQQFVSMYGKDRANNAFKLFESAADKTRIEMLSFEETVERISHYYTGEITGPGTLQCDNCGKSLHFHATGRIPPCSSCHATRFTRV